MQLRNSYVRKISFPRIPEINKVDLLFMFHLINLQKLEDSRDLSQKRFYNSERKLQRNYFLKNKNSDFLREHIALGRISQINDDSKVQHFLPHRG